jgi:pyridoxamine 5'-phosphate oxidase
MPPLLPTELAALRTEYVRAGLTENDAEADPIAQFRAWFDQAVAAEVPEPNAMTLATANKDAEPSARIVLLKGFDERGFVFFTNYESEKGRELAENPRASVCFFWQLLERQVRVKGSVARVTPEESEQYFHSRPRGSQLGAWASRQSEVIASRQVLEEELAALDRKYGETSEIPLPSFWGGYRLAPVRIEFWQGRSSRLHDRLLYSRQADGTWARARLSP